MGSARDDVTSSVVLSLPTIKVSALAIDSFSADARLRLSKYHPL